MTNNITYNIRRTLIELSYEYEPEKYLISDNPDIIITYDDVEKWLSRTYGISSIINQNGDKFNIKVSGLDNDQDDLKNLIEHMEFNNKEDAIFAYYSIITADLFWRHIKKCEFSSIK